MTKDVQLGEAGDGTADRGTHRGPHGRPDADVPEAGPAPSPVHPDHSPKASASRTRDEGAVAGDDTSTATQGKAEQRHAAEIGATKTQSGRGHRKHGD